MLNNKYNLKKTIINVLKISSLRGVVSSQELVITTIAVTQKIIKVHTNIVCSYLYKY